MGCAPQMVSQIICYICWGILETPWTSNVCWLAALARIFVSSMGTPSFLWNSALMTACANRFPESGSAIVTLVRLTLPNPALTNEGTYILAWSSRVPSWWLAWSTLIILDVLVISFDFLFVIPSCSIFVCFAGANAASWALISLALTKNPLLTVGEFVLSLFGLHCTSSLGVRLHLQIFVHAPSSSMAFLYYCLLYSWPWPLCPGSIP